MTDRYIVPTLTVRSLGPLEPGGDPAEELDAQEQAFREGMGRYPGVVTALERVQLPAGEALRVELQTTDEGPQIAQVQYFLVSRELGYLSLWFVCAESDMAECRSDFDAIAHSLLQ